MELPYNTKNTVLPHKQDVHGGHHVHAMHTCILHIYKLWFALIVFKLNAIKKN